MKKKTLATQIREIYKENDFILNCSKEATNDQIRVICCRSQTHQAIR